jgi:uncharacterized protein YdgA (DUF945 family)
MKKGVTVIAVLLIIIGLAPFINGVLMEKTVRQAFIDARTINAAHGDVYSLELVRYERNFYSSDIEWKINFGPLKTIYGVEEIVFTDHARHGYSGAVSTTSLEKNIWFTDFVTRELQGHNPFTLQTSYSHFGKLESTLSLTPFTLQQGNTSIEVGAGEFKIITDNTLQNFKSSALWQGLNHSTSETPLLGKISMDAEIELLSPYLWDGFINFSMESLSFMHPQTNIDLAALQVGSVFKVDHNNDTLSTLTSFACKGFNAAEQSIGRAEMKVGMRGMNTTRYENFMKMYTTIVADLFRDMAALQGNPGRITELLEEKTVILGFQLIAAYEELLQQNLEIFIQDLLVEIPEGTIQADITLRLLKDIGLMQLVPLVDSPEMALDIFALNSDIRLPVKLVGEPELLLTPLYPGMATGMFVRDGDSLIHRAETRQGKLFLNDREFVLSR